MTEGQIQKAVERITGDDIREFLESVDERKRIDAEVRDYIERQWSVSDSDLADQIAAALGAAVAASVGRMIGQVIADAASDEDRQPSR